MMASYKHPCSYLPFGFISIYNYCISESLNDMNILLLHFILVLYPFLLMISMYTLIELHGGNFRPLVILWKAFGRCFSKIRRNRSATDSIIHAYATLFLLSVTIYSTTIFIYSCNSLTYTTVLYRKVKTNVLVKRPSIYTYV